MLQCVVSKRLLVGMCESYLDNDRLDKRNGRNLPPLRIRREALYKDFDCDCAIEADISWHRTVHSSRQLRARIVFRRAQVVCLWQWSFLHLRPPVEQHVQHLGSRALDPRVDEEPSAVRAGLILLGCVVTRRAHLKEWLRGRNLKERACAVDGDSHQLVINSNVAKFLAIFWPHRAVASVNGDPCPSTGFGKRLNIDF